MKKRERERTRDKLTSCILLENDGSPSSSLAVLVVVVVQQHFVESNANGVIQVAFRLSNNVLADNIFF